MLFLYNNDKLVADWVSKKWGKPLQNWYFAIGVLNKNGTLSGAATFHNYNGYNIELAYYGPNTVTTQLFREIGDFCVNKLKVERLSVMIPRKNSSMVRNLPKFGFKLEGIIRHYYGPFKRDDGFLYGILASEGKRYL